MNTVPGAEANFMTSKLGRIAFFTIRFGVRIQIVNGIRFTNMNMNNHGSIRIRYSYGPITNE